MIGFHGFVSSKNVLLIGSRSTDQKYAGLHMNATKRRKTYLLVYQPLTTSETTHLLGTGRMQNPFMQSTPAMERKRMRLMRFVYSLIIATLTVCATLTAANAGQFRSPARIWVKIEAHPDETRWEACRRVFRHEVYRVRKGPGNLMLCYVEYDNAYGYGIWRFYPKQ